MKTGLMYKKYKNLPLLTTNSIRQSRRWFIKTHPIIINNQEFYHFDKSYTTCVHWQNTVPVMLQWKFEIKRICFGKNFIFNCFIDNSFFFKHRFYLSKIPFDKWLKLPVTQRCSKFEHYC